MPKMQQVTSGGWTRNGEGATSKGGEEFPPP